MKIAEKYGISIKTPGASLSGRTDSKSFEQVGIQAFPVSSGIIGPYHKPGDDPETIDYAGMEKISGLLYDLTVEAANGELVEPLRKVTAQVKGGGLPFFRFGLKANIGNSFHSYSHQFYDSKTKFSAEAGLLTQFKITKNFSIQPEVLYSTLASGFLGGNFRTHSVTVPVSLVVATKMNTQLQTRFYANLGGYYRYHFAGSAGGNSLDFDNSFEQAETGVVYGMGVEVMKVFVSVNFKRGLSGVAKDKNMGEFTSRATYFSLGYIF
ncbi:MAG: outer membrane beta-barrel protein, partial [Bacteroidia bacterium]|nr:outer membrane beta-barrel protein [Bacteroidia bacterium]